MKKFYLKTYGCQMNVYDSARIADLLADSGYTATDDPGQADMMLVNTCHIREKATEKLYSDLGRLHIPQRLRRDRGQPSWMVVVGCIAQAEGAEIFRRAPFVDAVVGPQSYHRLGDMIARMEEKKGACRMVEAQFDVVGKFDTLPRPGLRGVSAYLTIQEGCDKFCSFCVVPYTRGAQYSRPASDILREARQMVAQGVREITLLGQNVNAYEGEGVTGGVWGLGRLIFALADIDPLQRIRYTTSHPGDMRDDLYEAHRDVPQLMPLCHLPVQSGSDRILQAMNRRHTVADYERAIDRLREAREDIAISSDFIVAFPGETRQEFQATIQLVERIGYAQAYCFRFSPRPGTPAASMGQEVDPSQAEDHLHQLLDAINRGKHDFNRRFTDGCVPVLVEACEEGRIRGRSPWMQPIHAEGTCDVGMIVDVAVRHVGAHSLGGVVVDREKSADVAPLMDAGDGRDAFV